MARVDGARGRLVQRGARLHVRASAASRRSSATRAIVPLASPATKARVSAPSSCPTKASRVANFHRETVTGVGRTRRGGGPRSSERAAATSFHAASGRRPRCNVRAALSLPEARRVVVRYARRASSRRSGDGAVGQFRSGNHGRIARDLPSSRVELHCPDRVVTATAGACASRRASSGAAPCRCPACRGASRSRRRLGWSRQSRRKAGTRRDSSPSRPAAARRRY